MGGGGVPKVCKQARAWIKPILIGQWHDHAECSKAHSDWSIHFWLVKILEWNYCPIVLYWRDHIKSSTSELYIFLKNAAQNMTRWQLGLKIACLVLYVHTVHAHCSLRVMYTVQYCTVHDHYRTHAQYLGCYLLYSYRLLPVVLRFFRRRLDTRMRMATTTATMRMRPAMAMPMAKLFCEMQKWFGSYSLWKL